MSKPTGSTAPLLTTAPPPPAYGIPVVTGEPFNPYVETYILLPLRRRRRCRCRCCAALLSSSSILALSLLFITVASSLFFLIPSSPRISVARLDLSTLRVSPLPSPRITISLRLSLAVSNRDFFSLDYDSLDVSLSYRGLPLGSVASGGGHIRARGVSYVDAHLKIDAIRVFDDVFYLIEDLARGSIPFETVEEVEGKLHLFFLNVPIKGKFSCSVHVNAENQTIIKQDCY